MEEEREGGKKKDTTREKWRERERNEEDVGREIDMGRECVIFWDEIERQRRRDIGK